jgi:hypothetical protein
VVEPCIAPMVKGNKATKKLEIVMAPRKCVCKAYRGLNPWQKEDYQLLMFLAKGENAINGFRNRDLRKWLYPESEQSRQKYCGRTTRRIKLLRVHGLVRKAPRANRYVLTEKGQKFSCALMTASSLDIKTLTEMAA